jgi:hypothetical protein
MLFGFTSKIREAGAHLTADFGERRIFTGVGCATDCSQNVRIYCNMQHGLLFAVFLLN